MSAKQQEQHKPLKVINLDDDEEDELNEQVTDQYLKQLHKQPQSPIITKNDKQVYKRKAD